MSVYTYVCMCVCVCVCTHTLLNCKGQSLRCSLGQGNSGRCAVMLYVGKGPRGSNGACSTLHRISVFHSATRKLGPSGAGSRVGGLVHALGPCGSLQQTLL